MRFQDSIARTPRVNPTILSTSRYMKGMARVYERSVPKYRIIAAAPLLGYYASFVRRRSGTNVITAGRYRVHGAKIDIYLSQGGQREWGRRGIKQSGSWVLCPGDYIQRKPFPPRAPSSPSGFGSERARNGAHPVGCSDGFPPLPVGGRLFEL